VYYRNLIHNVDIIPGELSEPIIVALSFSFIQFGLMDFINSAQYILNSRSVPLQFSLLRQWLGIFWVMPFHEYDQPGSILLIHLDCKFGTHTLLLTIHTPLPVEHETMYSIKWSSHSQETWMSTSSIPSQLAHQADCSRLETKVYSPLWLQMYRAYTCIFCSKWKLW
jgi:hypothetical protein